MKPAATPDGGARRRRRADQTRRDVLAAARTLFVRNGYAATTVADIAAEAGVALQTVYSAVGSKASRVIALVDQAREDAGIRGIDASARAHEGPRALLASGPRVRCSLMEHAGDIVRLLAENAGAEPDIARAWSQMLDGARAGAVTAMELLEGYGLLRPGLAPETAADQANALMHPQLLLYLLDRAWTIDRIEAWLLDVLLRTLTTLDLDDD